MILFTSDTSKVIKKIIFTYIVVSILTILFDRIYFSFSHGVKSIYMNFMFLYPLIGGAFIYFLLYFAVKDISYKYLRLNFNLYNTGISILTAEWLLRGIFQIAGTSSNYMIYYTFFGWSFIIISLCFILIKIFTKKQNNTSKEKH